MTTPMTTTSAPATNIIQRPDEVSIRDFTIKEKRIKFQIDADVFEAYALLGLPLLQEMIQAARVMGDHIAEGDRGALLEVFDKVLLPRSAERFRERALATGDEAIDVKRQLIPILYYLLEEYGVRPTQPSSDSSSG